MVSNSFEVIDLPRIRHFIGMKDALDAVRSAYGQLARGEVQQPAVIGMEIHHTGAEVHAKAAYIHGSAHFSVKLTGSFPENLRRHRSNIAGEVFVFDASSGDLAAILRDQGYLTELRTAAAGALSAQLLARPDVERIAVIGTSIQARAQFEALSLVRQPGSVAVFGRTQKHAEDYAAEMSARYDIPFEVSTSVEAAVSEADLVITVTSAREILVRSEWIRPGTHITAVGSDMPGKQELDPALLKRAKVVVDRLEQCATQGELQHALGSGLMTEQDVHAQIGEIVVGTKQGRTSEEEITIADFTGVGALDAAMANLLLSRITTVQDNGSWRLR